MARKTSFDHRIVRYEDIHSIAPNDFGALVGAASINDSCRILDCGCGYGAVTREVLRATENLRSARNVELRIDLVDESMVQLERAKRELQPWNETAGLKLKFINGVFPDDLRFDTSMYDVVFCKMVLHEINREGQLPFVTSIYDCLKEKGRFVFWDVCLSPDIADFYRAVVRMKDLLAGYETMAARRNFLTEEEIRDLFAASPFEHVELIKDIKYQFDTLNRLAAEFEGDKVRLAQWNEFIRASAKALGSSELEKIHYRDDGGTISFQIRKIIAKATRNTNSVKLVHS